MAVQAPKSVYFNLSTENGVYVTDVGAARFFFISGGADSHRAYVYQSNDGTAWPDTPIKTQTADGGAANTEIGVYTNLSEEGKYYKVAVVGVSGSEESEKVYSMPVYYKPQTTKVGNPEDVALKETVSRAGVELAWEPATNGTNNSVTGYDVQQRDSADGSTWGNWTTASGSPVSGRSITVYPPDTVGHYRQFRVRTRGSAGSSYYSSYVTSSNTLRRKWDAFGAWADAQIIPRETYIRAEQIAQIRERIDEIRDFYGLEAYAYTPLVARETKIAKWAVLIQELRDAIDEIGTVQGWNTLEAGKPRIAHITQLRQIIDEM